MTAAKLSQWKTATSARLVELFAGQDDRRWLRDASILLAAIASLSAIFWHEASGAVAVWIESPTFNHCFLILPLALFMMWSRRTGTSAMPEQARWPVALLILPLSFAWFVTSILSVLELQQFVVMTILQVMLLAMLGPQTYRRYLPAFLYLYFLVPSGAELVPSLQQLTAHLAVTGLRIIGIPVYSNGAVIEIPAGTFAVAEACAGLRFLVATVAFGVFYATQIYAGVFRRLVFMALCVIVPVIANGLRVLGIIAAAQWLGSPTAAVADHLIYGWIFFSLILILLVFVGHSFADDERIQNMPRQRDVPAAKPGPASTMVAGALSVAMAAVFPVLSLLMAASGDSEVPNAPPALAAPWHRVSDEGDWTPVVSGQAKAFLGKFSDGRQSVFGFLALYPAHGRSNNLIRSTNRLADERLWKLDSTASRVLAIGQGSVPITETVMSSGGRKLRIWSFYVVNGHAEASLLRVKLRQLTGYFGQGACSSAFVAIAAYDDEEGRPDDGPVRAYLSALEPLSAYLCRSR